MPALTFILNGAPFSVADGSTLADLIDTLELRGQALALAVNRSVVRRHEWPTRAILPDDRIDLVRAIGGG